METRYLTAEDNTRLAYIQCFTPGSPAGVVILHGLAEHKGRYNDFIQKLRGLGYSVFAMDLRGHGESQGARGDISDFNLYITDLNCLITFIKSHYPRLKIALFGHSLGGLITTVYVTEYNDADMLILSSPLLKAPANSGLLKYIPYRRLGFIKFKKRHSESAEMLRYSYDDPLASIYFSLRLMGVVFYEGIKKANSIFSTVKAPVLFLGGGADPLLDSSQLIKLSEMFGSGNKTVKIYKNAKHRLVQGGQKDMVINEIDNWITDTVRRALS